jgi:1-deoxy-D-xylulose-5-phosphate reductoisomerase
MAVGPGALETAVRREDVDQVVVATSGVVSLRPTLAALEAGKLVAVANKEVLVCAGQLVTAAARRHGGCLLPIDSEHSAIWQCLRGEARQQEQATIRRLILTASGGAFRDWPAERLASATAAEALRHPNWSMGPKITVDSATLMNKGLEVLEAAWVFDLPLEQIEILVHRESIVHSLVECVDLSVKAQLGLPDMRLPIQYALAYPERLEAPGEPLDLLAVGKLTFQPLDRQRFPCPDLAYQAGRLGATYPAALNAANEEAVRLFLGDRIPFLGIPRLIERVLEAHLPVREADLAAIEEVDRWARRLVAENAPAVRQGGIIFQRP